MSQALIKESSATLRRTAEQDRHRIAIDSPSTDSVKLFVQIPCLNEAESIAATIQGIPKALDGVTVSIVVIDDGSTDQTQSIARAAGANHVIVHKANEGLASAFRTGLETCLKRGPDVIVNLDGDNQYSAADIPRLIEPILDGTADIVVGDRRPGSNREFSWIKRRLECLGSRLVGLILGQPTPDAVSGFRAFSRKAAIKLSVESTFSYTIETLLQAKVKRLAVAWVVVRTHPVARPSRLARSIPEFVVRSGVVIARTYYRHYPLRVFFSLGVAFLGNRSRGGAMIFQIDLDMDRGFRPQGSYEQAKTTSRTAA